MYIYIQVYLEYMYLHIEYIYIYHVYLEYIHIFKFKQDTYMYMQACTHIYIWYIDI